MNLKKALDTTYLNYVEQKGEENRKSRYNPGQLSASSAGSCFKQQLYKKLKFEEQPIKPEDLIVMRAGTIIHEDYEKAINSTIIENKPFNSDLVLTEYNIKIPQFDIVGHLDILLLSLKERLATIIDIKTVRAYYWRRRFGLKKNRDPNPSKKHDLQVGTYALGMEEDGFSIKDLYLFYINKDTCITKLIKLNNTCMDDAYEYWENLKAFLRENQKVSNVDEIKLSNPYIPIERWECFKCRFSERCLNAQ